MNPVKPNKNIPQTEEPNEATEANNEEEIKQETEEIIDANNDEDVEFNITNWNQYDENDDEDDNLKRCMIQMFGTTKDGKTVYVLVDGYTPYFFIKKPENWKNSNVKLFVDDLKKKRTRAPNSLIGYQIVKKHSFRTFTDEALFDFIQLIFSSYEGMKQYTYLLNKKYYFGAVSYNFQLYESNIEPLLRMIHLRDVQACGWIKVPKKRYKHCTEHLSYNDINIQTKWLNLEPVDCNDIAKLKIASFDIECTSEDGSFPQPERPKDKVIQIGTVFMRFGELEPYHKHIITLDGCTEIEGVTVESYATEREVLLAWTALIQRTNPDIIIGYNVFGFDYRYLRKRSECLKIDVNFSKLGRMIGEPSPFVIKDLSSSALGENKFLFYDTNGRTQIDLFKVVQREYSLDSYKLDSVASKFISEKVVDVTTDKNKNETTIVTGGTYGLEVGRFIKMYYNDGLSDTYVDEKYQIIKLQPGSVEKNGKKYDQIVFKGAVTEELYDLEHYTIMWSHAKDDITPNEMFEKQKGTDEDRNVIASYCIQDCDLVLKLMNKLQIIPNNVAMANVSNVPLQYIFLRGQGVKIFSLVAKKCRKENYLIPVLENKKKGEGDDNEEEEGYEGAVVKEPITGIHNTYIPVLDYSSLYPSSMIHKNISNETIVTDEKYMNKPHCTYQTVQYKEGTGENERMTTCTFAKSNNKMGILPMILSDLLSERGRAKKMMEAEKDPFKKSIFNGRQLAFKVTANSVYGQTGASTGKIADKRLAAATTATGREMLDSATRFIEKIFKLIVTPILNNDDKLYNERITELLTKNSCCGVDMFPSTEIKPEKFIDKKAGINTMEQFIAYFKKEIATILHDATIDPICIYGDTDSTFINFRITSRKTGEIFTDKEHLPVAIKLGILCGELINKVMPFPQNLAYEKTFYPFIIISKKRYVGNKYEVSPDKFSQTSTGIVLKRRDNAPIVKIVVGGVVKTLLSERDKIKAVEFLKSALHDIIHGKYPIDKYIVSKTLKNDYKFRDRNVHVVLADRMAKRDPGNKPQSNDRIPYVYINTTGKITLQGDRVEHPAYVVENNLEIDYEFYITNQIMKPTIQFLEYIIKKPQELFDAYLQMIRNKKINKRTITSYMKNLEKADVTKELIKLDIEEGTTTIPHHDSDDEPLTNDSDGADKNNMDMKQEPVVNKVVKKAIKTTKPVKKGGIVKKQISKKTNFVIDDIDE